MKKLYLVILIIISTVLFSEEYTKAEKLEIRKQFGVFQNYLKKKDFEKSYSFISFQMFDYFGVSSDDKSFFFTYMKELTYPKIGEGNVISRYHKAGNSKKCDFTVSNEFISSKDADFFDSYNQKVGKYFVINANYYTPNVDKMNWSDDQKDLCFNSNTYIFQLIDNELKLVKIIQLP